MTLILSPNLVLTAPAAFDPSTPVIGWQNQITASGVAADFEEDFYPVENLANPSTNLIWRSSSLDVQYITFALNEEIPFDYIGVARHNLGSGGVIISVEVQTYESEDWVELVEGFVVASDAPILIRFLENLAAAVRLKLTPLNSEPEIGVVYVGKMLSMPRGIPPGHTPLIDGRVTRTTTGNSEAGEYLGSIILSQKLSTTVAFDFLEEAWYRENMRPFVRQGRGTPFFFSGFPESHPNEAGYAWLTNDPRPDFIGGGFGAGWVNVSLDIGGIIV